MPRRNHHQRKRARSGQSSMRHGRSHSHVKQPLPNVYTGDRLALLAHRLAVILASRGVTSVNTLDRGEVRVARALSLPPAVPVPAHRGVVNISVHEVRPAPNLGGGLPHANSSRREERAQVVIAEAPPIATTRPSSRDDLARQGGQQAPTRRQRVGASEPLRLREDLCADSTKVCKRHPHGPTAEPCHTCKRIKAGADREKFGDVCRRHPNGDTGEPCAGCAAVRRRRKQHG